MSRRRGLSSFAWTLFDQALVSVGSFAVNIALARLLPRSEYGTFAAVFVLVLLLQIVNVTVVSYPATLRLAAGDKGDRAPLVAGTLLFTAATNLILSMSIALSLAVFGESRLIPGVVFWFAAWQFQEALRRLLFAEFRYSAAIPGDAISYLGQAAGVGLLVAAGKLSLPAVFMVLGATSLLGAAVQMLQVGIPRAMPRHLLVRASEDWKLGFWSLIGSAVAALRVQVLFWLVGITSGRADLAALQAVVNVVNVVNPIVTGVCNIVPQTAARAARDGTASAWKATRAYVVFGLAPTAAYAVVAAAAPDSLMRIVYGAGSPYLADGMAVRIMAIGLVLNYGAEMVCAFLHGLGAPRLAWLMNLVSLVVVTCAFAALQPSFGWYAAVIAWPLGQAVRVMMCPSVLKRAGMHVDGQCKLPLAPAEARPVQVTPSSRLR